MVKNRYIHFFIMISIALVSVALAVLVFDGCGSRKGPILAKIDEEVVTLTEFNERISKLPVQYQEMIKKNKARFLDDFIVELLFCKEAIRRGIDKQRDTKEVLREARRKILMAKFIEEEVENKVNVEEAEIRDYYEKHKDKFIAPPRFRASHILVRTEEKAVEVLNKLSSGTDFEELAKVESIDITNKRGGDLGYFTKGQLIPEFEDACMKMDVGQTSPVVKTPFGYHIIKLTDKKEARIKDFGEVREEIKTEITSMKRRERFNNVVRDLKGKAHIRINHDLIKNE